MAQAISYPGHYLSSTRSLLGFAWVITCAQGGGANMQEPSGDTACCYCRLKICIGAWRRKWASVFRRSPFAQRRAGTCKQISGRAGWWEDGPGSKCCRQVFTPVQRGHNLLPTSEGANMQSHLTTPVVQLALCWRHKKGLMLGWRQVAQWLEEKRMNEEERNEAAAAKLESSRDKAQNT